ncbi:MAG: hypothetical protein ACTHMV_10330 [Chitinophagaceae bacterium]
MKRSRLLIRVVAVVILAGGLVWVYARQAGNHFENGHVRLAEKTDTAKDEEDAEDQGTPTGDDPWKEMEQLVKAYYSGENFLYKGTVKLIDDNQEEEKVMEEYPFQYQYAGGDFYYSLDSTEFVRQAQYLLAVDHRGKLVSLSGSAQAKSVSKLFDISDFRGLMEKQKASAVVTIAGGVKMLTLEHIQDPQIQGYRIYYDPQTYSVQKMLIGMLRLSPLEDESGIYDVNASPEGRSESTDTEVPTYSYYMEIGYKEKKTLPGKSGLNILDRFVSRQGKSFSLQPAYIDYQMVNMIPTDKPNHESSAGE